MIAIVLAIVIAPYSVRADTKTASEDSIKLKSFVESGINYIKSMGNKKAYAEFSKPGGKFSQDELYLFVYDNNGKCLAHGSTPNRIGKNFFEEQDKYGTRVIKIAIELAKTGGGFMSYYWPSPKTNAIQFKTSYIKAIDKNTLIGSGLYKIMDVPKAQLIKIEELKAFVNSGTDYFKEHEVDEVYKEFSNPQGKFRRGGLYLFVLDYNGIILAHGESKELIGKNFYSEKDEFGTPFIQLFIQAAKSGGGMVSYYWPEPISKKTKLKISYIKPLNNETFIGAGIYED